MSLNPIKAIILAWVKAQFIRLSKTDGRPGLTAADLDETVVEVKNVELDYDDAPRAMKSATKANVLGVWIEEHFKGLISPWVARLLGYLAYKYAERKGVI